VTVRTARWLLFALFALTVPVPLLGPFGAFAPTVRYVMLAAATGAVAATEGAAGPVLGILALFAIHAAVYLVLAWVAAWIVARLGATLSPAARRIAVYALCAVLLLGSLVLDVYLTPFGPTPRANLLGVLS
jgi:hypothetical protein